MTKTHSECVLEDLTAISKEKGIELTALIAQGFNKWSGQLEINCMSKKRHANYCFNAVPDVEEFEKYASGLNNSEVGTFFINARACINKSHYKPLPYYRISKTLTDKFNIPSRLVEASINRFRLFEALVGIRDAADS